MYFRKPQRRDRGVMCSEIYHLLILQNISGATLGGGGGEGGGGGGGEGEGRVLHRNERGVKVRAVFQQQVKDVQKASWWYFFPREGNPPDPCLD